MGHTKDLYLCARPKWKSLITNKHALDIVNLISPFSTWLKIVNIYFSTVFHLALKYFVGLMLSHANPICKGKQKLTTLFWQTFEVIEPLDIAGESKQKEMMFAFLWPFVYWLVMVVPVGSFHKWLALPSLIRSPLTQWKGYGNNFNYEHFQYCEWSLSTTIYTTFPQC